MCDMKKKMCYLGIALFFIFSAGCKEKERILLEEIPVEESVQDTEDKNSKKINSTDRSDKQEQETENSVFFVYVCGAVNRPGVYELEAGSRVYTAIQAAGGMTEEADQNYLNQAESLKDGQQVYVPSKGEAETDADSWKGERVMREKDNGKVNLNTAGKEELMTLTGIGEAKAESIIRYREENGEFQTPEDLMKIEGIKTGVFDKIKEQITV